MNIEVSSFPAYFYNFHRREHAPFFNLPQESGAYFPMQWMLCSEANFVTIWLICKWATKTKYHKLGSFEQQKFVLSQFWRPDIQNQGLGRAMHSLKFLRKSFFLYCLLSFFFLVSGVASNSWGLLAVYASIQSLPLSSCNVISMCLVF